MKEDLFPFIMKPYVFVDDRIAELEHEMVFGKTRFLRKSSERLRDRHLVEKEAEQIRKFLSPNPLT